MRSSRRPPRSSMSILSLATTTAFPGREIVANLGFVSSLSKRNVTGLNGPKAELKSANITCNIRSTKFRSIVVKGLPSTRIAAVPRRPPNKTSTVEYISELSIDISPKLSHSSALKTPNIVGNGNAFR